VLHTFPTRRSSDLARPTELLEALELFAPENVATFHFHRKAMNYFHESGQYLDPLSAVV
jgi:hypothetical protein